MLQMSKSVLHYEEKIKAKRKEERQQQQKYASYCKPTQWISSAVKNDEEELSLPCNNRRNTFSSINPNEQQRSMDYKRRQSTKVNSMMMMGILHHTNQKKEKLAQKSTKIDFSMRLGRPESAVRLMTDFSTHSRKTSNPKNRKNPDKDAGVSRINCSMNIDEQMRIDEHAERLATSARKKGTEKCSSNKFSRLQAINQPYLQNNHNMQQILKSKTTPLQPKTSNYKEEIETSVDIFLDIIHLETKSAISLQCCWRRHIAIINMKELLIKRNCAIIIQSNFRGMVTKSLVLKRRMKLVHMVIRCQSYIRRKQASRKWQHHRRKRHKASITCQSIMRMFLAKCNLQEIKRTLAVVRIQSKWRQYLCQVQYKYKRYGFYATKIQSHIRMINSKRFYYQKLSEESEAAIKIQQYWRRVLVYQVRNALLRRRDCYQRSMQIRLLESEERFGSERVLRMKKYFEGKDYKEILNTRKELETKVSDIYQTIEDSEKNFIELKRQRGRISPKSSGHGWDKNIHDAYKYMRNNITKNKLDFLFENGKKLRDMEQATHQKKEELENAKLNRDKWSKWKDEELKQLWEVQKKSMEAKNEKSRQQGPGIERRKWAITLRNVNGKPITGKKKISSKVKFDSSSVRKITLANGKQSMPLANLMEIIQEKSHETRALQFETIWSSIFKLMEIEKRKLHCATDAQIEKIPLDPKLNIKNKLLKKKTIENGTEKENLDNFDTRNKKVLWSKLHDLRCEKQNFITKSAKSMKKSV